MRTTFGALGTVLLVSAMLVCPSGCRVESSARTSDRFNASDQAEEVPWSTGGRVTVNGLSGNIFVVVGSTEDTVRVTFSPFHYWEPDQREEALQMLADAIQLEAVPDGAGVHISTDRDGPGNGMGADIRVELPTSFDGVLDVSNRSRAVEHPGDIEIDFVGAASEVLVSTESLGDCDVNGASSVKQTTANCDGEVYIRGVSDDVSIITTSLQGDVAVDLTVESVSDTASGGTVDSYAGDVNLTFPAAGDYSILATTWEGVVDEGNLPTGCTLLQPDPQDPRSKTVSCGTGIPQYAVNACTGEAGDCSIHIWYR